MIHSFGALHATETRYGHLLYPATDPYIGRSLRDYGEFSESEVAVFREYVRPGDRVCDIGANFGCHSLALARLVGRTGAVFSFEPVLTNYWLLCANVALNGLYRVRPMNCAIGDTFASLPVPVLPYHEQLNFGGLSLEQPLTGEPTPVYPLDSFGLPPVRFMKIDVEHMEPKVIRGARQLIDRDRPVIYFEAATPAACDATLAELPPDYRARWHFAPLYNPDNYAGVEGTMDDLVSRNVLAIPPEEEFPALPYLVDLIAGHIALQEEA
jgi:FkbM family methyltransferase